MWVRMWEYLSRQEAEQKLMKKILEQANNIPYLSDEELENLIIEEFTYYTII